MIIGVLKDLNYEKVELPAVSGDIKKYMAQEDDIIFKLNVGNKPEEVDYEIISNDPEKQKKYYIFDKTDIISKIKINNSYFYIISGDIKEHVAK